MNSPQAQIRTRRSSIVVRRSLRQSIIAPQGASALSLEEKAAQFDAHFPAPNKQVASKQGRSSRRGSVAITQNLKDLHHAKGHRKGSSISHFHHTQGHTTDFHPEEKKKQDFLEALRTEFLVDVEHKDHDLYTNKNLLKRESLKFEKRIQFTLKRLWNLVDYDGNGMITKDEYLELHKRLVRALVGVVDEEEEKKTGEEDWLHDTPLEDGSSIHVMSKPQFVSAFFRMVDVWTEKICVDEYSSFLEDAFDRISQRNADGTYSYKDLDKIRRRGRRSSVIVQNGKMLAAQLLELQNAEKSKRKKVKKVKKANSKFDPDRNWWDRLYSKGKYWKQLQSEEGVTTKSIDPIPGIDCEVNGLDGLTLDHLTITKDKMVQVSHVQNGHTRGFVQFHMDRLHFANIRKKDTVALYIDRSNPKNGSKEPIHLMDVNRKDWWRFYQEHFQHSSSSVHSNLFLSSFRNVAVRTQHGLPLSMCGSLGSNEEGNDIQKTALGIIGTHVRQMRSATMERNNLQRRGIAARKLRPATQGHPGKRFRLKKKKRRQIDWLKVGGTSLSIGGVSLGRRTQQLPPVSPIVGRHRHPHMGRRAKTPSRNFRYGAGTRQRQMQVLNFGVGNGLRNTF